MLVNNEHGVVLRSIHEATLKDKILQDVGKRMKRNDWEQHKNRSELKPYYLVRHELFRAKGLLLRNRQLVIPEELQKQVIAAAHKKHMNKKSYLTRLYNWAATRETLSSVFPTK